MYHHGVIKVDTEPITNTPEYQLWIGIKTRCYNEKRHDYKRYGARGIKMCDEWLHDYKAFRDHIGDRPSPRHSLDRIDNDMGYQPGNVRWANRNEQNANKSNNNEVVGVYFVKAQKLWAARLIVDGTRVLEKHFKSYKDAVTARKEAEIQYGIFI